MTRPFLPPSTPCTVANPLAAPPLPSLPTMIISAQSSMSPSPTREEKLLKLAVCVLLFLILFVELIIKLRQCSSSSAGHIDGGNGRTSNEINAPTSDANTDDISVSFSVL